MPEPVLLLEPYREDGTWVFDDPSVGLKREPFVGETNQIIDRLSAKVPNARLGFRLHFSAEPFEGQQASFTWLRADSVEGDWYREDATGIEGWLCPSLRCYFPQAPKRLFLCAKPKGAATQD